MYSDADGLLILIQSYPQGLSEYELLTQIYRELPADQRPDLRDSLVLFREHFCLFHTLYTIRDQQRLLTKGDLTISALKIQWLSYRVINDTAAIDTTVLTDVDALREYYLNLNHLADTDRAAVDKLLNSVWQRFVQPVDKQAALAVLELCEPTDLVMIKKRYRQLLSSAHPDHGGCHERTQQLNEAMAILKRCYQ